MTEGARPMSPSEPPKAPKIIPTAVACRVEGGWGRHGCDGCVKLYGPFIEPRTIGISIHD